MEEPMETPESGKKKEPIEIPELPPVDKNEIWKTVLPVIAFEAALTGIMLIVYAAIGKWSAGVLYGALLGAAAVTANFGVMILTLFKAEKADNTAKGELLVRGTYFLRMLVLLAVIIAAVKTGYFDVVAVILPMCFMRAALYLSQLVLRKKEKGDVS